MVQPDNEDTPILPHRGLAPRDMEHVRPTHNIKETAGLVCEQTSAPAQRMRHHILRNEFWRAGSGWLCLCDVIGLGSGRSNPQPVNLLEDNP